MKKSSFLVFQGFNWNSDEILTNFNDNYNSDGLFKFYETEKYFFLGNQISPVTLKNYYVIGAKDDLSLSKKQIIKTLNESGNAIFERLKNKPFCGVIYDIEQQTIFAGITNSKDDVQLYIGVNTETGDFMISNHFEFLEIYCDEVRQIPDHHFYMNEYLYNLDQSSSKNIYDFFLQTCGSPQEMKKIAKKAAEPLPPIEETYNKIKEYIIGQDQAIKEVLLAVYNNHQISSSAFTRSEMIAAKENVLFIGPSGVGKTEIVRQLQNTLDIPVTEEDIQIYSPTGYEGKNAIEILDKIYKSNNGNLEKAEHSILFLDEIDKKIFCKEGSDFALAGLNQFLKIMEGGVYQLSNGVDFDTTPLTVICAGAFMNLLNDIKNTKSPIGFQSNNALTPQYQRKALNEALLHYGVPAEFLSRIKRIVQLKPLSLEAKRSYLLSSKLSILNLKLQLLANRGITINFAHSKESFVNKILEMWQLEAIEDLGIRGLNAFTAKIFDEINWNVFNQKTSANIWLDETEIQELQLYQKGQSR